MSRFRPDGWMEGLIRTFEMIDVSAGVYVETRAPDLRPAALVVALVIGILVSAVRFARHQTLKEAGAERCSASRRVLWACVLGWLLAWGAWLSVSGNGRYVLPLLILVAPLLGANLWRLPIRADWKWLMLVLILAGQGLLLHSASPSQAWSMLKSRWTVPGPFASQNAFLEKFDADLIIVTHAQTMTALLVDTLAVKSARLLSLDFADAMGDGSSERGAAMAVIASTKRPILLDAFNVDYVEAKDMERLRWRKRSQELLAQYGLQIDEPSCQKVLSPLNVMQVACGLKHSLVKAADAPEIAPAALKSMERLIKLCGASLWPYGAQYAQEDGSLVQVFRETRYVVRAVPDGALYVQQRQDINFNLRWGGPSEVRLWENMKCNKIIRRSVDD